jgi:hypothetical protein
MAGLYTRKMYDNCALQQDTKQSTDQLELLLDPTKYIHCDNICQPSNNTKYTEYPPDGALLVDVESDLTGRTKFASRCDSEQYPFCAASGCLLPNDVRVPNNVDPEACSWGHSGERAVITTNMRMPNGPGYTLPPTSPCGPQRRMNVNTNGVNRS